MASNVLTPPVEAVTEGHRPAAEVHRLAAGTELLGQYRDSGLQEPRYLVRRSDGQVMQLPALLYRVAGSLDGVRDDAGVAAAVSRETGQEITGAQVRFLVEERLRPVGVIAPDADRSAHAGSAPAPVRSDPLLALRYRVGAIPAGAVWRIAGVFLPFFRRPAWMAALAAFVALDLAVLLQGGLPARLLDGVDALILHPELSLLIIALTLVGGVFHECGHVAACRYGGATPGAMGIGLYLVWPALYSTVTDAYRLDRVGRLRTDLGGVYFNAVFMAGVSGLYLATGQSWLLIALIGLHTETAWQFLPSIRLDGYYILADLIGVPDLFSYLGPVLKSLRPGRPVHPNVRRLRPWPRRVIVGWVAVVVPTLLFWLAMFLAVLPRILPTVVGKVLAFLDEIRAATAAGDVAQSTLSVFQLVLLVLPWVGSALISWSLIRMLQRLIATRVGSRLVPRGVGRTLAALPGAAIRRGLALAALLGIGLLLVVRVARVAGSHPATAAESRLSDSALAAVRGVPGGPPVSPGEWLTREQLAWYARLTGAFERHATVVAAGRELAVVATAVLVACLLALVATRGVRPLAAALPLVAALATGPAVATLATVGPGVVGAAWAAAGGLLVVCARGRVETLLGVLLIAVGLATEPMVAAPLAVGIGVLAARRAPRQEGDAPAAPRHARPGPATGRPRRWLVAALVLPAVALGVALATRGDTALDGSQRTVLLLLGGLVVTAGVLVRRVRPAAAAAGGAVLLAAPPWSGAGDAVPLALAAVALLGALLTDAVSTGPVKARPHPLLRGAVALPVLVLTAVGALFAPSTAPRLPVAELAAWITGPSAGGGTVAVPSGLWGDLVRDGVPPERLVPAGPRSGGDAAWTVAVGAPAPATQPSAFFGDGAGTVTVQPSPRAEREVAEQAVARRGEAAAQAARQAFGGLLAGSPRLSAPPDVLAVLSRGGADARVLAGLADLASHHALTLGEFPDDAAGAGGLRSAVLVAALDGRPATRPEVAGVLRAWGQGLPEGLGPVRLTPGPSGITLGWPPPAPAAGAGR